MRMKRTVTGVIAMSLIAVALVGAGLVGNWDTAVAQNSDKTVSNLQATSNDDGDMVITWSAPSESPKDYRVAWAKADENYQSWKDSSGNAFPTDTTHTVTGPDAQAEYKIKVRARYNSGGPGPWSAELRYTTPAASDDNSGSDSDNTPPAPHWESGAMPAATAMFDWSDVDDATGYDLQMNVPENGNDNWVDITAPGHAAKAYVHGSAAIIGQPHAGPVSLRVRATFEDGTATDWYLHTVNTSE